MMADSKDRNPAPVVWLLTDNKPGHRNQLKGLGNRLRALAGASLHEIDATKYRVPLWKAALGKSVSLEASLPHPDLIIAAGSGTHRLLLSLRRMRKSRTVVLMKPAFPLGWVDAAIIPAHDEVNAGKRILVTEGVINSITPLARITEKPEALVLIGGPSHHYEFDADVVSGQLTQLIAGYRKWRWTIATSRRTPADVTDKLNDLSSPTVTLVTPEQTPDGWLSRQLAASRAVWVTPDSMSMVCEAITSGVPTGAFQLPDKGGSRVARGIRRLLESHRLASWSDHASVMGGNMTGTDNLWEADRVARWLIERFLPESKR
jgi:mitochondrial fission protein ELM1